MIIINQYILFYTVITDAHQARFYDKKKKKSKNVQSAESIRIHFRRIAHTTHVANRASERPRRVSPVPFDTVGRFGVGCVPETAAADHVTDTDTTCSSIGRITVEHYD